MNGEFARLAAARKIMARAAPSRPGIASDRAAAERWIRRFAAGDGGSNGGTVVTRHADGRLLVCPPRRAADGRRVLYVHGGGMVYYSTDVFRSFLSLLASELECVVEAFDYLKAPEHSIERSVEDLTVRMCARAEALPGGPVILAGDSVGGLLSLYLASRALPGAFARLVMIYPVLDLWTERESYAEFGENHFLDATVLRGFKSLLRPYFAAHAFDPFAMSGDEFADLPPCSVVTAGCDVLRDEGAAWVSHVRARGGDPLHQHFADLPHDFCLYSERLACAREAVVIIARTAFPREEEHVWS